MTIDASSTGSINLRLKLCAQWSDVAKVIDDFGDSLNASNVAYALFRLGCLYCFMSEQRKHGTALHCDFAWTSHHHGFIFNEHPILNNTLHAVMVIVQRRVCGTEDTQLMCDFNVHENLL